MQTLRCRILQLSEAQAAHGNAPLSEAAARFHQTWGDQECTFKYTLNSEGRIVARVELPGGVRTCLLPEYAIEVLGEACTHVWVDTGLAATWCKHCDLNGRWIEGRVHANA